MHKEAISLVLKASGHKDLNPAQKEAMKSKLLDGKSLVFAAPTASGKTIVAEVAALETVRKGRKVVYIVPLKALATEKYEEFKSKYSELGVKVAISIGDLDTQGSWLSKYDIIICTSEKLDSLLRHGIDWVRDIGLVIADEIHLLNDPGRGPTLEMVLTRLREYNPTILGLSATISNYQDLAKWLDAEARASGYRPVKLYSGVCHENEVNFLPKRRIKFKGTDHVSSLVEHVLGKNKQALVFVNTRRGAEAAAEKLISTAKDFLKPEDRQELGKTGERITKSLETATKQCSRLRKCVESGTAFHHAGLTTSQRKLVEENFRAGKIKVIAATPTLAAGINLPSYMAIVRDMKRFQSVRGMDYIPNLEIMQMLGRCGRPQYDTEGLGVVVAKSNAEARYAWDNYIQGEPEEIHSKLGVEPVLRTHVLALVATGTCTTRGQLLEFFGKTFYAHQYGDMEGIAGKVDKVVALLQGFKFVKISQSEEKNFGDFKPSYFFQKQFKDYSLEATRIGKRVSQLYIDPVTANLLIQGLADLNKGFTYFGLLHTISTTLEMRPLISVRKKDLEKVEGRIESELKLLKRKPPNQWDLEYDDYAREIKTAMFFEYWMQEHTEDQILEEFGVTPGELRVRLSNADWLLYSAQELGLLMGYKDILNHIRKTRLRVKYGISEDLLPLVKLKGIGRVRARKLFASGFKTLSSLRKVPLESLERIVGPATADNIKKQLNLTNQKSV